jgi:purine-binding chemotaxis protein CheW
VAEVVEPERLVDLPLRSPGVLGLCTLRREVLPVIDLEETGSEVPASASPTRRLVLVLRTSHGAWGVRIDPEGTVVAHEAPLALPPSENESGPVVVATVRRGESSHAVIDPEATWRKLRRGVEDFYLALFAPEPIGPGACPTQIHEEAIG